MGLTTKFLSNLFALFILSFCTANSQFTWSLPEVSQHEIVDFASINNPASGQTLISTTTRMFGAAVNSGSNNFNIIVLDKINLGWDFGNLIHAHDQFIVQTGIFCNRWRSAVQVDTSLSHYHSYLFSELCCV